MALDLLHLQRLAENTLTTLISDEGIYASAAKGKIGHYHGFFGRDSTITAAFIRETEEANEQAQFLPMAINSLLRLSEWQGQKDDPVTREQLGKIPHEIREHPEDYQHLTAGYLRKGVKPFYVDPTDSILKNWDSNDATPLWIIVIARLMEDKIIIENDSIYMRLERALRWCLRNIEEFGGFAGYTTSTSGKYYELPHQSWKDWASSYQHHDGRKPTLPIHDVAVNAWMWAALRYGAHLFKPRDPTFSRTLSDQATRLKKRFNEPDGGFLMTDEISGHYFAEAIDGKGHQLHGVCSDPALALWGYFQKECIIESAYIPSVVTRIIAPDMFDDDAGIRIYSSKITATDPTGYHRGPHTFWPFISGLIGIGMQQFGYRKEADTILTAMLRGVAHFDSCIEMFIKIDGKRPATFTDQKTRHKSAVDQAWTAGAVYYAAKYLADRK